MGQTVGSSIPGIDGAEAIHLSCWQGGIPESAHARALGWGSTHSQNMLGLCSQSSWRTIPQTIPNAAHLRLDDALCRRVTHVGSDPNGPCGLGDDSKNLREIHADAIPDAGDKAVGIYGSYDEEVSPAESINTSLVNKRHI